MEKVYKGKTKDFIKSKERTYFHFKDTVTGIDGVFDPGGNEVAGVKEGSGKENIKVSTYFFELLEKEGVKTHFISSNLEENEMDVVACKVFGEGLEVITRFVAVGSFIRRYGLYAKEGQELDAYTEFTLKDDQRQDPLITEDALVALGLLSKNEYEIIKELNIKISKIIREELAKHDLRLYDIKLEYGKDVDTNEIILIDEVSGGNMRVYKDGEYIDPLKLSRYLNI